MIQRYDIATDEMVEVTQEYFDQLERKLEKLWKFTILRPDEREAGYVRDWAKVGFSGVKLKTFPNPMRSDGLFIAEDLPIEQYPNVFDPSGEPQYPAVPAKGVKLAQQVLPALAEEIVKRWNAYESKT